MYRVCHFCSRSLNFFHNLWCSAASGSCKFKHRRFKITRNWRVRGFFRTALHASRTQHVQRPNNLISHSSCSRAQQYDQTTSHCVDSRVHSTHTVFLRACAPQQPWWRFQEVPKIIQILLPMFCKKQLAPPWTCHQPKIIQAPPCLRRNS